MWILETFLHSCVSKPVLGIKILGYCFLLLGGGTGAFFLFQALSPIVGYLESGGIISSLFIIFGIFLLWREKSKSTPQEEAIQKIGTFFKELNIEKILKEHAIVISLLSVGAGIILSRIKNVKNISEICKKLK